MPYYQIRVKRGGKWGDWLTCTEKSVNPWVLEGLSHSQKKVIGWSCNPPDGLLAATLPDSMLTTHVQWRKEANGDSSEGQGAQEAEVLAQSQ